MADNKLNAFERKFAKMQFGLKVRIDLYKKIASFLKNGVPVNDIIQELETQYLRYNKGDIRATILGDIRSNMSKGESFGEALGHWVPPSEAMIIQGGEKSGNIGKSFHNAIKITESASRMKSTIIGEISYPAVLLMMLSGLIYMFSTQAIPELTSVLPPENWPPVSQKLYHMSKFVEEKWWLVVAVFFTFVIGSFKSLDSMTGTVRNILNKVPPWSIYKTFQSSVFLISTSAMMSTGTPIFEAMSRLRKMSPKYVANEIDKILKEVDNGTQIGDAMNSGFLDRDTGIDVSIYGKVANLQEALDSIGSDAIENGIEKIKGVAGLLKNLVLFGVASYIGWVYYAFYTLTQAIGDSVSAAM